MKNKPNPDSEGWKASTESMGAQTVTLAGSGKPIPQRRLSRVKLASGRVVQVDHGQDFATLSRFDPRA